MEHLVSPPAVSTAVDGLSTSASPSPSPSSSPSAGGQKLRLMCSYGGHIIPRPADKTLCYAGGETRIVAVDRRSVFSLQTLTNHLSKSLMNGKQFNLKYQLPNHDLDSLISISTEEDLANMIDEYDRLATSAVPSRLRFFLFPVQLDSETHDPTSEDWFVDALKNAGVVAKGRSLDSGEVHSEIDGKMAAGGGGGGGVGGGGGGGVVDSLVASLQESIPLEKNSSFGSNGSSTSNSPAIRGGGGGCGGGDEGGGIRLSDFKIALPLVDCVGSDSCTPSPHYSPHGIVFHDVSTGFLDSKVASTNLVEAESNTSSPRTPVHVPSYILTKPMDQQHQHQQQPIAPPSPSQTPASYIHQPSQPHYVTQYYPTSLPLASYTTMYDQPFVQPHQQTVQYQVNKPQPVFMMSVGQPHNHHFESRPIATAPNVGPSHPQVSSSPVMVPMTPPPVYITPAAVSMALPDDLHHQVVAFPPASQAGPTPLESTSYIGEFEDPMHAQIYKTQPPAPTVVLSETLAQLHVDNSQAR